MSRALRRLRIPRRNLVRAHRSHQLCIKRSGRNEKIWSKALYVGVYMSIVEFDNSKAVFRQRCLKVIDRRRVAVYVEVRRESINKADRYGLLCRSSIETQYGGGQTPNGDSKPFTPV